MTTAKEDTVSAESDLECSLESEVEEKTADPFFVRTDFDASVPKMKTCFLTDPGFVDVGRI